MHKFYLVLFFAGQAALSQGQAVLWHVGAAGGVVASFGPSENQAELVGGQNSLSYDGKEHLSPAFKSTATVEITGGLSKNQFRLDGALGWFQQPITLVLAPASSSNGPTLATMDMMNIRLTPAFRVLGNSNDDDQGIWLGPFVSFLFPTQTSITPGLTAQYGITGISQSMQFNWGGSFRGSLRIGHSGVFCFAEASVTMPGIVGSVGSFQLDPGSSYSLTRSEIKMYSLRFNAGIGCRFSRSEPKN